MNAVYPDGPSVSIVQQGLRLTTMDTGRVKTFINSAATPLPALVHLASTEASQRLSEDDAMIRQLPVGTGEIVLALIEIPRRQPPMPPSPNDGAPS